MDTFIEMIEAVQSDLNVGNESPLFSVDTIKSALNRAYRNKATAVIRWPHLEDAKLTSSRASQEYYGYPRNWRPNSIWKLKVDGIDYEEPLAFKDYDYEKDNDYPSGKTKIWSNKANRFFISPAPATDGSNNIEVHGVVIPEVLSGNTDTTIFSYNMPECNEAIVLEAVAMLKRKGEEQEASQFASAEAKSILVTAAKQLRIEQAKYERRRPMFNVGDLLGSNPVNRTGNFF